MFWLLVSLSSKTFQRKQEKKKFEGNILIGEFFWGSGNKEHLN